MPSEDARKIFKQRFVPVSRIAPSHRWGVSADFVRPPARVASSRSGMVENCRQNTTMGRRCSLQRTGPGTSGALRIA
eukprot:359660-Prymnesium_polylepis.1